MLLDFGHSYAVYPRVCGGTGDDDNGRAMRRGLSPRMRGNHSRCLALRMSGRSIPAYAGEPVAASAGWLANKVYPRVCGGTGLGVTGSIQLNGLSPRMRGNRTAGGPRSSWRGSIPAYAGEPAAGGCPARRRWVYPRVCGGTLSAPPSLCHLTGLSPRMRGNPTGVGIGISERRSIPAYAGEPPAPTASP